MIGTCFPGKPRSWPRIDDPLPTPHPHGAKAPRDGLQSITREEACAARGRMARAKVTT
jgi:hypothetical protein